jgi:hypothetical protein
VATFVGIRSLRLPVLLAQRRLPLGLGVDIVEDVLLQLGQQVLEVGEEALRVDHAAFSSLFCSFLHWSVVTIIRLRIVPSL